MLVRCLSRLRSAPFVRLHSSGCDRPHKQAEEAAPAALVKKLSKSSPPTAHAPTKSHSLEPSDPSVPVSEAIRRRIVKSGARFHCNDNISEFIRQDELSLLVDEVAQRMQGVLRHARAPDPLNRCCSHMLCSSLVIDTVNDHNTADTARRVAKMFVMETFSGRYRVLPHLYPHTLSRVMLHHASRVMRPRLICVNAAQVPPSITSFPNVGYQSLCVLLCPTPSQPHALIARISYATGPISVRSTCAHHFQNIVGKCWVGVVPDTEVAAPHSHFRPLVFAPNFQRARTSLLSRRLSACPNSTASCTTSASGLRYRRK